MTQFTRFNSSGEILETVAPRVQRPAAPPAPWFFASAMAASTLVAIFAGLVLGFLAATESGYASEHWTEVVQAHGRLQLFGWVAVFVVALSFEFAVRFNQRPAISLSRRLPVLAALGLGALLAAGGQLWYDDVRALWVVGEALVLAGSLGAACLVIGTFAPFGLRHDPAPLWFGASMLWLVLSASSAFWSSISTSLPVVPLDESRLAVELMLRGFVINVILAVGMRAFPGHVDLPPIPANRQRLLWAVLNLGVAAWALGCGAFFLPDSIALRVGGDLLLASALLAFTLWSRILGPRPGMFGGPRYRLLIPLAWTGAVIYALLLAGYAVTSPWWDPSIYQEGAVRHMLLLGFMAPMMAAMAHIVLARFGTGRIPHENALTAGFALILLSAPLRVVPAIVSDSPGSAAQGVMGLAAVTVIAGLALVAFVCAETARAVRTRQRLLSRELRTPSGTLGHLR